MMFVCVAEKSIPECTGCSVSSCTGGWNAWTPESLVLHYARNSTA